MVAAILFISLIVYAICLYLVNECSPTCTPRKERYSLASLMFIVAMVDLSVLHHQNISRLALLITFFCLLSILIVLIGKVKHDT